MTKEEVLVEADKGTCIGECGLLYDDIIYYVLIDNKTHAGNLYSYNLKSRESNKLGAARELQRLEVLVDGKIYGCGYTKTGNPEVFLYDLKGKKVKTDMQEWLFWTDCWKIHCNSDNFIIRKVWNDIV